MKFLVEESDLQIMKDQIVGEMRAILEEAISSQSSKELYTEKEARAFLGLCRTTMFNYRKEGVIPFIQRHRKIYYRADDLCIMAQC